MSCKKRKTKASATPSADLEFMNEEELMDLRKRVSCALMRLQTYTILQGVHDTKYHFFVSIKHKGSDDYEAESSSEEENNKELFELEKDFYRALDNYFGWSGIYGYNSVHTLYGIDQLEKEKLMAEHECTLADRDLLHAEFSISDFTSNDLEDAVLQLGKLKDKKDRDYMEMKDVLSLVGV